ncbi:MAG TPA: response regulator transcription factor [Actinomycetales bacterium]|jgi:DNA-binding NarL/FixJ family response regulator|nr:response regulator transcription factor [Actinomycetales bacterium]
MANTVMLLDDHQLIRHGLVLAFRRSGDFEVIAEASTVAEGMALAQEHEPDVVVVDIGLPDGSGLDITRRLRDRFPALGIVVLTMYAGDEQLFAALEAGASAFVAKSAASDDVVAAARHAASSPHSFTAQDLSGALRRRASPSGPQLTTRESEVLNLLAEGLGVAAISRHLYISDSTTKTHITKVYDKLGAGNRAQAIMNAVRAGLLARDDSDLPRADPVNQQTAPKPKSDLRRHTGGSG